MSSRADKTTTLIGTYRQDCKTWIQSRMLYNYPITDESSGLVSSLKKTVRIHLYNRTSKPMRFYVDSAETVDRDYLQRLGYPTTSRSHAKKYILFKLAPDPTSVETQTISPELYRQTTMVRLDDFAQTDEDRSFLSHWLHTHETVFAKPYEKRIKALLPPNLVDFFSGKQIVGESQVQCTFFPDLFDVPFLPLENPRFTFIDLFAGIGGFRMALQRLGGKCVFSSEWDASAKETYLANYGEMPFGDITKEETKSVVPRTFDVLCAGFPCQPFSISGKMKGFNDARGTLFFDVCTIIQKHRPRIVFLENVKHLVHHDNGNTLRAILTHLRELGYEVSWRLLNASNFGVPQNRERIIIVGTREEPFDFNGVNEQPRIDLQTILDARGPFEYLDPQEYTLIDSPKRQESGLVFVGYRNKSLRKAGVRAGTESLSRVHKQPNRIYSVNGMHPTLPSQEVSGRFFILTNQGRVRKLTVKECYKLMGFPNDFVLSSSTSSQYKQIGNAVCVPMIQAVGAAFLEQHLL